MSDSEQSRQTALRQGPFRVAGGVLRTARPKQWAKNLLVVAAPAAAGVLFQPTTALRTLIAFCAFCIVASGVYFINDVRDWREDVLHPVKKNRPIPAGVVGLRPAVVIGVLLLASGFLLSATLNVQFVLIMVVYVVLSVGYSLGLRRVPIIDICIVASGFFLRALAGAIAVSVPVSEWFLLVSAFGSLFIVASKRHAESVDLGDNAASHRATLGEYSDRFLEQIRTMALAITMITYCLWAVEKAKLHHGNPWYFISIAPFLIVLLRYAFVVSQGKGSAPEEIMFRDRGLQLAGVAWLATVMGAVL